MIHLSRLSEDQFNECVVRGIDVQSDAEQLAVHLNVVGGSTNLEAPTVSGM